MKAENLSLEISRYEEMVRARLKMQGESAHYFEEVVLHNGISWVNHSMATTVDMTWHALRDIPGPVLLMIGALLVRLT